MLLESHRYLSRVLCQLGACQFPPSISDDVNPEFLNEHVLHISKSVATTCVDFSASLFNFGEQFVSACS